MIAALRSAGLARRSSLLLFLIGITLAPPAGATCEDIDPLGVLPGDQICPGWTRDGEPMAAYTLQELMLIIDGEAFLYDRYGFVAAAFQNYAGEVGGEPAAMTLAAFNQGTAENARALFHDPDSGGGDPLPDWTGSGEARVTVAFGFVTFQFWEECFFVSIVVNAGGQGAVPDARCMGGAVVDLISQVSPVSHGGWGSLKALYR